MPEKNCLVVAYLVPGELHTECRQLWTDAQQLRHPTRRKCPDHPGRCERGNTRGIPLSRRTPRPPNHVRNRKQRERPGRPAPGPQHPNPRRPPANAQGILDDGVEHGDEKHQRPLPLQVAQQPPHHNLRLCKRIL